MSPPLPLVATFGLTGLATDLLGLTPTAGALADLIGFYFALVQQANVRTPQLLGHFMQRPEAHGLHHERGVHAYNYGSFHLWDILFRTFRNPASFPAQDGFWAGASSRVGALLAGRDLAEPR